MPPPVNRLQRPEMEILNDNKVVTAVVVARQSRLFSSAASIGPLVPGEGETVESLWFHSSLMFNYYLVYKHKSIDVLQDHDEVVIDFNKGLAIRDTMSVDLGFGLWYNTISPAQLQDDIPVVRAIDVLYGLQTQLQDERPHWRHVPLNLDNLHFFKISAQEAAQYMPELKRIHNMKQGVLKASAHRFKMFQVSDLHFANGYVDSDTDKLISAGVAKESPDLIIINGDLVEFQSISRHQLTGVLLSALNVFIRQKVPFVVNWGESDYLSPDMVRSLEFVASLPYCINTIDTTRKIHGWTNYNYKIYADEEVLGVVSVLDSHQNNIKNNQINSMYRFNTPDLPIDTFKLAFVHYPLPNFRPVGKFAIVGDYNEKGPLNTSTDQTFINDFLMMGYNVISASHEHTNDGCIFHQDDSDKVLRSVWLCYSSVAGSQATAPDGFDRRLRVFEIKNKRLLSWKIVDGKGFHYSVIKQF
ncbi:purple acid phosphatase [Yamadazyma tenuis]|uniref:Calcineurin-like phosphoesterase domain-containing protein n=1 Tax=Candida tenuis (strain ATCC 10573 / BCRC 21748 / CBS 615 / JCM 9827 / NBRC 10315 / NRRL Y-1498 / VKM Y-70) TaxID=590646 RepID=G3BAV8_CANTC|nr:uncharacterized protein CANTEDRAFT_114927 [Yamadazyma tenuis ATCC 10573]EGV61463.1 hypothetical protein CANTEDRAFT_114927 [Yamadazyma tenuis ATCC 10573]WEJ92677.1 purple acid phosphatase [Yamadazyma tenuis]